MVYCSKCGAKNEEEAEVCVKCGEPLHIPKKEKKEFECFGPRRERHMEEECFGLPHGSVIAGIIFGLIIIFAGFGWMLQSYYKIDIWWIMGPVMAIVVGILIIIGALYAYGRR